MKKNEITFNDLEQVLYKLKEDIREAVTLIVGKVRVPIQVDISSIEIPISHITCIGDNTKGLLTQKPHVNIALAGFTSHDYVTNSRGL